ncbi:MAG: pyruvate formate lyase family protein, partial [Lentisphaeria bacterium]
MLFGTFSQDRSYLERKFQEQVCDPTTGEENDTLKQHLIDLAEKLEGQSHEVIKARAFAYICEHVQISVNPQDWFVAFGCWNRNDRLLNSLMAKWSSEVWEKNLKTRPLMMEQNETGASNMWPDFDHSVPDWDAVFTLGFPGLRERARKFRRDRESRGELTDAARAYFDGIEITYTAILDMLQRFQKYAVEHASGNKRMLATAKCLDTLIHGAPTNTYEVLQLVFLFFIFGEHIDRFQVRSLGNLDRTVYPYYRHDLDEKRYTEENIREFFAYFLMQWSS